MKLTLEEIERHANREKHELNLCYSFSFSHFSRINDISLICYNLDENTNITKLNLNNNSIGYKGAKALAENSKIKVLDVSWNNILTRGVRMLAANSTLTKLDVCGNKIGDEGAKAIATNNTLTMLNIGSNYIGAKGAKSLAANTSLTTLILSYNNIGDNGAIALAANTTLKNLYVCANRISAVGAKALASNSSITTLRIRSNDIKSKGVMALISNKTIISLDISLNNIDEKVTRAFIAALKNNITLIKFINCFLDRSLKEMIEKVTSRNKILPWLTTIRYARIMAQAQRSENCPLGTLPVEMLSLINDYSICANHFSFFAEQFDKRPTAQDLVRLNKWLYLEKIPSKATDKVKIER